LKAEPIFGAFGHRYLAASRELNMTVQRMNTGAKEVSGRNENAAAAIQDDGRDVLWGKRPILTSVLHQANQKVRAAASP
jgi:hypothetical protein